MRDKPEAAARLTDEQRIELVQEKKRREQQMYLMLSISGVLAFLVLWEMSSDLGWVNSRYLAAPSKILGVFLTKLTDPNPDGAVLGMNVLSSLQVSLTGFFWRSPWGSRWGCLWVGIKALKALCARFLNWCGRSRRCPGSRLPSFGLASACLRSRSSCSSRRLYPCVINAYTGIRQTNPVLVNFARPAALLILSLLEGRHPLVADDGVCRCARGTGQRVGKPLWPPKCWRLLRALDI